MASLSYRSPNLPLKNRLSHEDIKGEQIDPLHSAVAAHRVPSYSTKATLNFNYFNYASESGVNV